MERHVRKISGEEKLIEQLRESQQGHKGKSSMARPPSMSEGPMITDGKSIEAWGRKSFEHSVKVELAALKKRLLHLKAKRARKKLKKKYGTEFAGRKEPPEGPRE